MIVAQAMGNGCRRWDGKGYWVHIILRFVVSLSDVPMGLENYKRSSHGFWREAGNMKFETHLIIQKLQPLQIDLIWGWPCHVNVVSSPLMHYM